MDDRTGVPTEDPEYIMGYKKHKALLKAGAGDKPDIVQRKDLPMIHLSKDCKIRYQF